jgi:hypothetical protein
VEQTFLSVLAQTKNICATLILAEIELLLLVAQHGIADKLLVAFLTQIESEVFIRLDKLGASVVLLTLLQQLTNRLHVVFVEISFDQLGRIMGRVRLNANNVTLILPCPQLFAA